MTIVHLLLSLWALFPFDVLDRSLSSLHWTLLFQSAIWLGIFHWSRYPDCFAGWTTDTKCTFYYDPSIPRSTFVLGSWVYALSDQSYSLWPNLFSASLSAECIRDCSWDLYTTSFSFGFSISAADIYSSYIKRRNSDIYKEGIQTQQRMNTT